jgi:hypothetical protein
MMSQESEIWKNNVPLDERNRSGTAMTDVERDWPAKTRSLDWSYLDGPDPYWLNRITWSSLFKGTRDCPGWPGEQPGKAVEDDHDRAGK